MGLHKRQVILFLTAILLPAAVLAVLSWLVIHQDRELAQKRADDERNSAVEQMRRELAARLETIKLQEINRLIRDPHLPVTDSPSDPAIVLVTPLDGNRIVLPWQSNRRGSAPTSAFAKLRKDGESLEFLKNDPEAAIGVYRQALEGARGLEEHCEAQMLVGRALVKAGAPNEAAARTYRTLLERCDSTLDDDGIPFSIYAAARLIELRLDAPLAYAHLGATVRSNPWLPPLQAYMIRSLLASATGDAAAELRGRLASKIVEMEQIQTLADEFLRLSTHVEPLQWFTYGDEPWLVTVTPAAPPLAALLFVISSSKAASPGTKLVTRQTPDSHLLGEGFPGLR